MTDFARLPLAAAIRISGEFKRIAATVGVHWRTAYKWSTGEAAVPRERVSQVEAALESLGGDAAAGIMREVADLIEEEE